VVTALGYGTTGLSVGQRVFGLTDWTRDGTLAEYSAVEARNLAPLPGDVDFTVGASLPISGLTAWQGLFEHGRLQAGQSVLAHGAAGAVGSMVTQLAREAGAYVIGTGRAADRQTALDFGAKEFVDLENDALEDVGGSRSGVRCHRRRHRKRSAGLIRAGGTLVSIVGPPEARPADGLAVDFVVESDRAQLSEIVQRVRDGRLRTNIGNVSTLDDAVRRLQPDRATQGEDDHPRSSGVELFTLLRASLIENVAADGTRKRTGKVHSLCTLLSTASASVAMTTTFAPVRSNHNRVRVACNTKDYGVAAGQRITVPMP
jgi:NADPH:quinone reductase-like Zn-dependent oxidoreductase